MMHQKTIHPPLNSQLKSPQRSIHSHPQTPHLPRISTLQTIKSPPMILKITQPKKLPTINHKIFQKHHTPS